MTPAEVQMYIVSVAAFMGALGGTASLAWWLSTRFNNVYDKVVGVEQLLSVKIDDHEKLDVERFNKMELSIMRLELLLQNQGKGLHQI